MNCAAQGYGNVRPETHELSNFQTFKGTACICDEYCISIFDKQVKS